jgi:catechol 2,3-dioxygenase-like lactoylglutathione lyase family enzyme
MALKRMDNTGIVFEDLDAAVDFFLELGMELEGRMQVEGPWVDQTMGLDDVRCDIAMLRTPDGHGKLELAKYRHPQAIATPPDQPHNTIGMYRVMFEVDDLDDTLARLGKHGAVLVGEVAQYEDILRICYVRGPEGIFVGLAQNLN